MKLIAEPASIIFISLGNTMLSRAGATSKVDYLVLLTSTAVCARVTYSSYGLAYRLPVEPSSPLIISMSTCGIISIAGTWSTSIIAFVVGDFDPELYFDFSREPLFFLSTACT